MTKAVEVHRSLYYYHKNNEEKDNKVKRGRPSPGYSVTVSGTRVPDEQIEEYLMEAVEGEEGIYGYHKLRIVDIFSSWLVQLMCLIDVSSVIIVGQCVKPRI